MSRVRIKICGVTNKEDAIEAVRLGADALGFIFAPSPRRIEPRKVKEIVMSLPPWVSVVGVFADEKKEILTSISKKVGLDYIQLHGNESPQFCAELETRVIKTIKVKSEIDLDIIADYNVSGILLDTYSEGALGGTGLKFNWNIAKEAKKFGRPIILAGGLNAQNVCEAVNTVIPYGVEANSGIEKSPGLKDKEKMEQFIQNVKKIQV